MSLKQKLASGFFWSFGQQIANQVLGFALSIILARLLLPSDFGIMGMIYVFFTIGNVLLEAGLSQSLIRTTDADTKDYSTIFYANILVSLGLYCILFIASPFIANFYNQPILEKIIKIYGISFFLTGLASVQNAILTKQLKFKVLMLMNLPASLIGGVVGIFLATKNYGVWSLVFASLTTLFLICIQTWYFSKWKPELVFDKLKFKHHFNFGYKLMITNLLNAFFVNVYQVIFGKIYNPTIVGFYTRADSMRNISVYSIINAVNKVTYPILATISENKENFSRVYIKIIKNIFLTVTPLLLFLIIMAQPIFIFLFTDKWLFAASYFQIILTSAILFSVNGYNANVISSIGRSDLVLKIEFIRIAFVVVVLVIAFQFGLKTLLWSQFILSIIDYLIFQFYLKQLVQYPLVTRLKDIFQVLLMTGFSSGILFFCDHYFFKNHFILIRLIEAFILFVFVYFCQLFLFNFLNLKQVYKLIKKA